MNDTMARVLECTHRVAAISRVLEHARCARSVLEQMAEHDLVYIEGDRVLNLTARTLMSLD
jgi:hypothetical protein